MKQFKMRWFEFETFCIPLALPFLTFFLLDKNSKCQFMKNIVVVYSFGSTGICIQYYLNTDFKQGGNKTTLDKAHKIYYIYFEMHMLAFQSFFFDEDILSPYSMQSTGILIK